MVTSDNRAILQRRLGHADHDVRVLETATPLELPDACAAAAQYARGEYLVVLHEHATIEPGWLYWLVRTADQRPDAGAIGSSLLFPDGRLQEAGAIVWWDGRSASVGCGTPADAFTWRFVRPVDSVSSASFLIRRATWDAIGGLDPTLVAPYHDIDLCLRIAAAGHRVLLEPRSRVRLLRERTSEDFQRFRAENSRLELLKRWKPTLRSHEPCSTSAIVRAVHRSRGSRRRVLIVDDFIPEPSLGAGFGRMHDVVLELAATGHAVAHFSSRTKLEPPDSLIDAGMSIVEGDLTSHLNHPDTWYDVVLVSRPHNFDFVWPAVRTSQPWARLVYDCEALWWRRVARQAEASVDAHEASRLRAEAAAMRDVEARNAVASDLVVAVSEDERQALVREMGVAARDVRVVHPVGRSVSVSQNGFHDRRDIGMVAGWMAGLQSPNGDGLLWFVREVLPVVRAQMPWVRIRITGSGPPPELLALSGPNLCFEGLVTDLPAFYDRIRVVVSPTRFGSGVKVKTIQALQYGVPTVAMVVAAEGLPETMLAGLHVSDDPLTFAHVVLRLLTDSRAWQRTRETIVTSVGNSREAGETASWPALLDELCSRKAVDDCALSEQ